jgi:Ca2+/Na+ antiporter
MTPSTVAVVALVLLFVGFLPALITAIRVVKHEAALILCSLGVNILFFFLVSNTIVLFSFFIMIVWVLLIVGFLVWSCVDPHKTKGNTK